MIVRHYEIVVSPPELLTDFGSGCGRFELLDPHPRAIRSDDLLQDFHPQASGGGFAGQVSSNVEFYDHNGFGMVTGSDHFDAQWFCDVGVPETAFAAKGFSRLKSGVSGCGRGSRLGSHSNAPFRCSRSEWCVCRNDVDYDVVWISYLPFQKFVEVAAVDAGK